VADHLSRLDPDHIGLTLPINEVFPDEHLLAINAASGPWYADIANYLASGSLPRGWPKNQRERLMAEAKYYFWDNPLLFRIGADQIIRRCIPDSEFPSVLSFCHDQACGGHFSGRKTAAKVLQCGFFWPSLHQDAHTYAKHCTRCQSLGSMARRDMMPLQHILAAEIFDIWGIDFMGPFPVSFGYEYILVAVDYVSKWIEAIPT